MKRPNIKRSRTLRKNQTDAEKKLWNILRNRELDGIKFRRQHPIDDYILDFYSPEYKLCIEVDGSQHYKKEGNKNDDIRTNVLQKYNIKVLRFSNRDILQKGEGVKEVILRELDRRDK